MKSQAQRSYLHIHEPEVAEKFERETPKGTKLPAHVKTGDSPMKGSHPKHTLHHGHAETHGAHHNTDGTHKEGAGKRMVEHLDAEHAKHTAGMAQDQKLPHPSGE
jgi:hypothetical protein